MRLVGVRFFLSERFKKEVYEMTSETSHETQDRLMTAPEVADYLQIHKGTVYSWVWSKKLPCVRIGDLVRFKKSEIDRALKAAARGKSTTGGEV